TALLAVLELLPLAVVGLVFNLGLPLLDLPISVSFSAVLTINALIAARAIHLVAKTLLVPREVPPPPMPLRPESRGYLYIWIKRFTNVITFGVLIDGLAALALMPEGPRLLMIRLIGLAVLSMIFILVLQNRRHVGKSLGSSLRDAFGDTPLTTLAARFAELWHVFVLLYASGLFFTWFLGIHGGFTFTTLATLRSVLVIIAGILIYRLIRKGMTMLFALSDDLCRTFPGLERRSNRYFSVMLGIMRIGVTVLTVLTLLDMWNLDTLAILTSPEGRVVVVRLISVLVMLGVGVVLWEIIANTADRYLAGREGQDGSVIEVSQRAKTLVPLIRTVLMIVLITIVSLVVLSEIGVNIGPLLAGAGVIGLAISFGSQRLVQDVITGAFNLIEDTIAVGDVVTIGGHSGVVEGLSIRSVR
ncbi:MAG: mechanosensitive ion channel domain-containing protein, partial [Rhodospirillaceae bacterium]